MVSLRSMNLRTPEQLGIFWSLQIIVIVGYCATAYSLLDNFSHVSILLVVQVMTTLWIRTDTFMKFQVVQDLQF
jgi:hypothetical protein